MELFYFIVDNTQQLWKVAPETVQTLWRGRSNAGGLPCTVGNELRLITVLCDENLLPIVSYFVRLELEDGAITRQSRHDAFEAMTSRHHRRYDHPAAQRQFSGWPADWQHQLAVAIDVPISHLRSVGLGGPLLMSDLWGISLERVLEYFEQAYNE